MLCNKEILIPCDYYEKHATIYFDTDCKTKACILYFHGGGLLYGTRTDLPELHLKTLTEAGFGIIAYDYPLAPSAKLDLILEDICSSVSHYLENFLLYKEACAGTFETSCLKEPLPYFLWGRSAVAQETISIIGENS